MGNSDGWKPEDLSNKIKEIGSGSTLYKMDFAKFLQLVINQAFDVRTLKQYVSSNLIAEVSQLFEI